MEVNKLDNNLYFNPLGNKTNNTEKFKGFHLKKEPEENQTSNLPLVNKRNSSCPMGSVIIQNWETKRDIPPDIGELIHYPVFIDRAKFKKQKELKALPDMGKK